MSSSSAVITSLAGTLPPEDVEYMDGDPLVIKEGDSAEWRYLALCG